MSDLRPWRATDRCCAGAKVTVHAPDCAATPTEDAEYRVIRQTRPHDHDPNVCHDCYALTRRADTTDPAAGLRGALEQALIDSTVDMGAHTVAAVASFMAKHPAVIRATLDAAPPASPTAGGLEATLLAEAIRDHDHLGVASEVVIACDRGHVEVCAERIARKYDELAHGA